MDISRVRLVCVVVAVVGACGLLVSSADWAWQAYSHSVHERLLVEEGKLIKSAVARYGVRNIPMDCEEMLAAEPISKARKWHQSVVERPDPKFGLWVAVAAAGAISLFVLKRPS